MFIVTLPSADNLDLISRMYAEEAVDGARYNVGIRSSLAPLTALEKINEIAKKNNKKFFIDLKGRQLRILNWADPTYGDIELSHSIEVDLPAKVFFRGNDCSNLIGYRENKIFVSPDPKYALGAGQAINIIGKNLKIKGNFLTEMDEEFVDAALKLGIHDYMASFFHKYSDLDAIKAVDSQAKFIIKIEDIPGLSFVKKSYVPGQGTIMAACDDLMTNIGENKTNMIPALELIIKKDKDAIAASHLYTSLSNGSLSLPDITHMKFLADMGYKNYMLSDGVSHKHFDEAIKLWKDFKSYYG